jgi:hypothetical protein
MKIKSDKDRLIQEIIEKDMAMQELARRKFYAYCMYVEPNYDIVKEIH